MGTVLEDVERRHGSSREAVNKQSFELALQEMQHTHYHGNCLELRRGFRGAVDERTTVVEERVDEEGAQVFDDKDSSPRDLGACIDALAERSIHKSTYLPRSFTSMALLFRSPVSWTVVPVVLAIGVPSLPLVTLNR